MRLKLEKSARARRRAASRTWPTLRNPAACPSSRAGHCRGRSLPPPGAEVGSLIPLPDQGPDRSGFPPARRRAQARVGGPGRAGASDLSPKEMADGLRRRTAAGDRRSETRRGRSNDRRGDAAATRCRHRMMLKRPLWQLAGPPLLKVLVVLRPETKMVRATCLRGSYGGWTAQSERHPQNSGRRREMNSIEQEHSKRNHLKMYFAGLVITEAGFLVSTQKVSRRTFVPATEAVWTWTERSAPLAACLPHPVFH